MVTTPTQTEPEGAADPGFISRVSAVQVRPPLLPVRVCHTEAATYHGWPEISCSQLKALRESPLAFYWRFIAKSAPPQKSEALAYGTLLHTWAEDPDSFWARVAICPDTLVTATGAFSKKADEWLASLDPGLLPVCPADASKLKAQTEALLRNPQVVRLLGERIDAEFNIRTEWNGHKVRCRVDGATPTTFFDWKTTRDFSPQRDWWRSVLQFGYHLQAAMYAHCGEQAGWPAHRMQFVVTSTVWPHENCVVVLPEALIEKGKRECLRLLDELKNRIDWDVWTPLNSHEVCELWFPDYAMRD